MNQKQKNVFYRIILSVVLLVAVSVLDHVVGLPALLGLLLYLIPYGVIGYDILRKAWKGILKRQVFD